MPTVSYPLDTTGMALTNLVSGEEHGLTEVNDDTYDIIIPKFAPFYLDNFAAYHVSELGLITPLDKDVHYYFALPYMGASRSIGKMLYGGVSINTDFEGGQIVLTYQTLGGNWTADPTHVLKRLAELVYNPKTTVWDAVTNRPNQFPPINHSLNISEVYGQKELIDAINALAVAIATPRDTSDDLHMHLLDASNPHRTTAHQTGTYTAEEIDEKLKAIDLSVYAFKNPLPTRSVVDNTNNVVTDCGAAVPVVVPKGTAMRIYEADRRLGLEIAQDNCFTNAECSLVECMQCEASPQCAECQQCRECDDAPAKLQCNQCTECSQCTECLQCDTNLPMRECSECDWIAGAPLECGECTPNYTPLQCEVQETQCDDKQCYQGYSQCAECSHAQCTASQCSLGQCVECSHPQCEQCTDCYQSQCSAQCAGGGGTQCSTCDCSSSTCDG